MGETFWRMERAQRMRDRLGLKSIQRKAQGEEMVATMQASKAFEKDWRTPVCAGCGVLSMLSGRSGKEYCKKKMLKKYVQSRNVYENKQISDRMS
jgi:hypothetical protein